MRAWPNLNKKIPLVAEAFPGKILSIVGARAASSPAVRRRAIRLSHAHANILTTATGTGAFVAPLQHTETESLLGHLKAAVGAERWHVWFEDATDFHLTPDGLTVGVANLFISDYLKSHFADHLATAAQCATGRQVPVTFHVQPDLFQKRRAKNLADEAEITSRLGGPVAPLRRPEPRRLENRPLFTLDNFVVGPCNRMAYEAARSAAEAPGKAFHPLFVHGSCGLGKTHLLQGTLNAICQKGHLRAACLSAEQFTNRYLEGMRTGRLDAFRHHYRHLDVLVIDDVHFLAGKPATQEEFLHTFNEFEGGGRLIILASDSHPRDLQAIQDRLISRWLAGLVVKLDPPDAATRRCILQMKIAQLGHAAPDTVLAMVADRVAGSVRDLEGALTRLIAYAALLKQPITPDLARQALADFVVAVPSRAALPEIESAVTEFFGVTTADIHGDRKSRSISMARQVTMVLARELTDLSLSDIARMMGGKNHTTVLAACRKWHDLVKSRAEIAWLDHAHRRTMSAEALLNHLKDRLRD